jgi:SAM-dependent methyltransferase
MGRGGFEPLHYRPAMRMAILRRSVPAFDRAGTLSIHQGRRMSPSSPELESADCLLCGGEEALPSDSVTWRGLELHYVVCAGCGLKYMRPRPTRRWYARFYAEEFWQEKVTRSGWSSPTKQGRPPVPVSEGTAARIEKQRARARRIRDIVASRAGLGRGSTALDVGTAFGETPALLRSEYGCRTLGVEPSELCRQHASAAGVELVARQVEELEAPQPFDGAVDLVVMSHVLENLIDPRAGLCSIRRILAPNGLLYVDTPNLRFNNAINPYHPYLFDPETLAALLAQAGFVIVERHDGGSPRAPEDPADPYLAVLARPGEPSPGMPPIDVKEMIADRRLGQRLHREARSRQAAASSS